MGWFARGAGNGMISVANQMYKESNAQLESDLMVQRQQMLEEMKQRMGNQARTDMVARREDAKNNIVNEAVNSKYAGSDAAVSDAQSGKTDEAMTPEQLDVIAKSKDADAAKVRRDPMTGLIASNRAGDVSDKDVATVMLGERRADRQEMVAEHKAKVDAANLALKERGLDIKDKQVMAMIAKISSSGGGGSGSDAKSEFLTRFDGIKKRMPEWSNDQIMSYMNQAKTPGESYSQTESVDPLTGDKVVKTTRKGSGAPGGQAKAAPTDRPPLSMFDKK